MIWAMRILVTGASGFIGSSLVPSLLGEGHEVRAVGRDPERLAGALAGSASAGGARRRGDRPAGVQLARADVFSGEGLERALEGMELAYYLIHSMERTPAAAQPFFERERIAAENFASAAAKAGVRRIVYLGGLVPRWRGARPPRNGRSALWAERACGEHAGSVRSSAHLASREAVEAVLLGAVPDSLALRASIVIGARSRSFRLLVRLVERLPLLALPAWEQFRTQPIDARDVIAMLLACTTAQPQRRTLDVGGPDVLSYGEMLSRIAELMLLGRPAVRLGVNLTALTARVAAAIASEDPELVVPLMEGLQGDLLPADDQTAALLNVRLHSFDSAVEHALGEWEQIEPLAAR